MIVTKFDYFGYFFGYFSKFSTLSGHRQKILGNLATVEGMFSISGHILSFKRRKLGEVIFSDLVYLKLNENIL